VGVSAGDAATARRPPRDGVAPAHALYLTHGDTERRREAERAANAPGYAALTLRPARCSAEEESGGVASIADALLNESKSTDVPAERGARARGELEPEPELELEPELARAAEVRARGAHCAPCWRTRHGVTRGASKPRSRDKNKSRIDEQTKE
jgi:hypothetical protein